MCVVVWQLVCDATIMLGRSWEPTRRLNRLGLCIHVCACVCVQVVRQLVHDATVVLSHSREEAARAAEAQARAAQEWEKKQQELKAAQGE